MKKVVLRFWESSTFMTWGSFISKSVGTLIILGLVLKDFEPPDLALWFLFITIFNLQNIVDLGFNPTFSRAIAYANNKENQDEFFSKFKLKDIIPTMSKIYNYLSLAFLVILGVFGTVVLYKTISQTSNEQTSWMAWLIVCLASVINLRGNKYTAFLIGMNRVALIRRWEILFSLLRLGMQILFLALGANILMLVIATHLWTLLNVLRNKLLSERIEDGVYTKSKKNSFNKEIFQFMWPSAWRSGLGLGLGSGVIQVSSLIYAQIGTATEVASFLLAVRIMEAIVGFSQAPLYSKIPVLAQKYALGEIETIKKISQKGMAISLYAFTLACVSWGVLGSFVLEIIDSEVDTMPLIFWGMYSIANLIHRYGAMHIQLYSITNHIIWHKADGVSGLLYIVVILLTYKYMGIYSIIVGMLVGYIGFYAWYAAKHSYKRFELNFWQYDKHLVFSIIILTLFLGANFI